MNSRSTQVLLGVIAFLLGANLFVQTWHDRSAMAVGPAAGLPDTGAQLQAQIDELKSLNTKMDKLQGYLESGKLTVTAKTQPAPK
ncbi:MAG TPA: hypothetical protein VHM90_16350 [Phycisphaerae bacterium]|jgi:hypothetical protein|nr:hypothetical protein [Phycisphaerae bacterium]